MKTAVIDYNMGNLGSVCNALRYIGCTPEVIDTPERMRDFTHCILPGVGSFGDGMKQLTQAGFVPAIKEYLAGKRCLLGICLGMQMMLESSEESPGVSGLGIFPGAVKRFPSGKGFKVPQINWNSVRFAPDNPLANALPAEAWFYFVHSYYVPVSGYTCAETEYIFPFSSVIGSKNCFATQFHPEKSQRCGLKLLENFLSITPDL